jgi:hypothetical protein
MHFSPRFPHFPTIFERLIFPSIVLANLLRSQSLACFYFMRTRTSPRNPEKARNRAENTSFRWSDETRNSLLDLLLKEPELFHVKNISNRVKYTRILEKLDTKLFAQLKEKKKWDSVENGADWLIKHYRHQDARFKKTGEGPSLKERRQGARNLQGMFWINQDSVYLIY